MIQQLMKTTILDEIVAAKRGRSMQPGGECRWRNWKPRRLRPFQSAIFTRPSAGPRRIQLIPRSKKASPRPR